MKFFLLRRWKAMRDACGKDYWRDEERRAVTGEVLIGAIDDQSRAQVAAVGFMFLGCLALGGLAFYAVAIEGSASQGPQLMTALAAIGFSFLAGYVLIQSIRSVELCKFLARHGSINDRFKFPGQPLTIDADFEDMDDDGEDE